jgi:hypothetical protein
MLGIVGKLDFTVMHLSSSTTSFPSTWDFNNNQQCIGGSGSHQVLFPLTNFYILGWLYNFENPFFMFFLDQLYNIVFHIACTVKLLFSCSFWCIFFFLFSSTSYSALHLLQALLWRKLSYDIAEEIT